MAIPVNSILSRSAIVLQDSGAVRWSEAERLDWLNDGLRELAVLKPDAKVKRTSVSLASGAKQVLPTDAILLQGIETAEGEVVQPCVRSVLDAFSPGWIGRPSNSVINFMYSPAEPLIYYVYPAQADTSNTVELIYTAYPATATAGGNLDVQDKYANAILDYVLFRSYSKDTEFAGSAQLAAAYYQSFIK